MSIYIFDPTEKDPISRFRGAGRIIQILKENLSNDVKFIDNLNTVTQNNMLLIPFFSPFTSPLLTKKIAKKQILMIFDVIPLKFKKHFPIGFKGNLNLFLNKYFLKVYDKIITISKHSKKDIINYLKIPAEKIEVVYPTLSKIFSAQQPTSISFNRLQSVSTDYCLYVGDVNWNKNLVNLAKAIKIANVNCVFVGKNFVKNTKICDMSLQLFHPWQKEFKDFLTEVGDDKRFIFLGYVSDNELIKLYQQAKVNISISRDEGFGFSYLEASTLGCPSILSDIEIFREIADNSACFVNPNNPKDIAEKIRQIFQDKNKRNKLALEAQQRVNFFSQKRFQKALINKSINKNY